MQELTNAGEIGENDVMSIVAYAGNGAPTGVERTEGAIDRCTDTPPPQESTALRDNQGKPEMSYWSAFPRSAEAFARVMEYGAGKYEEGNYLKGGKQDKEYMDSFHRHLTAMMTYYRTQDEGDLYDDESGCLHMAHMLFNIFMWLDQNHADLELVRNGDRGERCVK